MDSIGNKKVMELIHKRNEFLNQNPKLYELQEVWDSAMQKAGSQHNRLVIANKLLMEKLAELQDTLQDFTDTAKKYS